MDRTKKARLGGAVIALLLVMDLPAYPGVLLVAPPHPAAAQPGESYPASSFGQPPAKVDPATGQAVDQGFAARESQDLDNDTVSPSRSPAGLVYGNDALQAEKIRQATRGSMKVASTLEPPQAIPDPITRVARRGVQEVAVIAGDLGFFPKTVFVTRDIPVRMFVTGASRNTLCIMMDSFQVRKEIRSQKIEEITFTPSTVGKYRFYCPINGMEGTMIVKEVSAAQAIAAGE